MNRICWWLVDQLSRSLQPEEQDALHGDFAELGMSGVRALWELLGLLARRQAAPAGNATLGAIVIASGMAIIEILTASVTSLFPFLLALLIVTGLGNFVASRLRKKQRKWEDSVKGGRRVLWSEIRRRPVGYWVWTIGLFVFLLYALSHRETMVPLSIDMELFRGISLLMMLCLILSGLFNFAVNRFGKKLIWEEQEAFPTEKGIYDAIHKKLVRAIPGRVVRSGIRGRPKLTWLTFGLSVVLLYVLNEALYMAHSPSVPLRPFWPVLILFAWSGLLLFGKAIAWRDFGATYFLCDSAFSPGGKITGRIYFQRQGPIEYNLIAHLECLCEYRTGDSCGTIKLWFSQREIPLQEFGLGPTGRHSIPIDFALPSSALESSSKYEKGDKIIWRLIVQPARAFINRSGGRLHVPYADRFRIPVVRRG